MCSEKKLCFVFPGQGSHFHGMAQNIYRTSAHFRDQFDACARGFEPYLNVNIAALLFHSELPKAEYDALLQETAIVQPIIFSLDYSLAQVLIHEGITPTCMVGHSLGELVAAVISGVFRLADAFRVVAKRGALMGQSLNAAMLAIAGGEGEIRSYLSDDVYISAVNSPIRCVVSGNELSIKKLRQDLRRERIATRLLPVAHAFHSPLMTEASIEFERIMNDVKLSVPELPFVSNITGNWITDVDATSATYWSQQIVAPVLFEQAIRTVVAAGVLAFKEVGPGRTLGNFIREIVRGITDVTDPISLESVMTPTNTSSLIRTITSP